MNNPSTYETKRERIDYQVQVLPCAVSSVTTPILANPQTYIIGNAGFTFGEILFEHDSVCDFEFNYVISGAPDNLIYSLDNLNFAI